MLAKVFFALEWICDVRPFEAYNFPKFSRLFAQKFGEGVVADEMDYNARNTIVLLRGRSICAQSQECLQRLLVAPHRRLGHVVIINALLPRLLVNLIAIL